MYMAVRALKLVILGIKHWALSPESKTFHPVIQGSRAGLRTSEFPFSYQDSNARCPKCRIPLTAPIFFVNCYTCSEAKIAWR